MIIPETVEYYSNNKLVLMLFDRKLKIKANQRVFEDNDLQKPLS